MYDLFQKYKGIFDYLPIILITLLFVAETEMEKHALNTSCQMAITIVTVAIFYILVIRFKNAKIFALIVSVVIWVILIYVKKKYMVKSDL